MENISQEELDNLNLKNDTDPDADINNLIVLIRNELTTLKDSFSFYKESNKNKIRKKLNKVLNEIIDIRKN